MKKSFSNIAHKYQSQMVHERTYKESRKTAPAHCLGDQAMTQGEHQAELDSLIELRRWKWESKWDVIKYIGRLVRKKRDKT